MGVNAAGLASKLKSFEYALKANQINIFCVQEVKEEISNITSNYLKNNFELFELVRKDQRVAGGGLMVGVDKDLVALQVRQGDDEVECLSVVVSVAGADIRTVCGYGPQRGDTPARKVGFWGYLEEEVKFADQENQILIIQIDSNAYAGAKMIPNDPNDQNENGRYLQNFMQRNPTLTIVNALPICKGLITRQRTTTQRDEKAIFDLFIVCSKALPFILSLNVDDRGEFKLSNFHGQKKRQKTTHSDHNCVVMQCNFSTTQTKTQRMELFNFKDTVGQDKFTKLTTTTTKLSDCFKTTQPYSKQAANWFKCLNGIFYQCFTKIRSRKRKVEITQVDSLLEKRKKLRRLSQNETDTDYHQQILDIEKEIGNITSWQDAKYIWDRFQKVADSDNTASTQAMWKWKKELFPKVKLTPPMGVKNKKGKIITGGQKIKDIYLAEYKHRLRPRPIHSDMKNIEKIQNQLFEKTIKSCK